MLLLLGFTLIFIFGYFLSIVLVERMHLLERLGISYLLGLGIMTLLMFCYSTLGIKITLNSTLIALVILVLVVFLLSKIFKREISLDLSKLLTPIIEASTFEKVIVVIIAGLGIASLVITTYFPVYIWDALAIYDFRGKIIAHEGFYTQIASNYFWFKGYPLFTSLSHTLVYLFGGINPKFVYSLIYISFIFVFYGISREVISRRSALISSLLLATIPPIFDHSTFAYTNLPYSVFLPLGSIYLYVWFVKKKPVGYLVIAAILTGLSTWTRSTEPFWVINILILLVLVIYKFKKYFLSFLAYIFAFALIREPWKIVEYYFLSNNTAASRAPVVLNEARSYALKITRTILNYQRISEVGMFIYKNVITSWYPVLFLFLFCLVISLKRLFKKKSSLFLVPVFLLFGLLLYATYIYSYSVPYWKTIPDSARRMAMFFMPMMIYYIGLVLEDFSHGKKK